MRDNIYKKLRARLDELATGYPETGAETYIRIMQERGKIQDLWVVGCELHVAGKKGIEHIEEFGSRNAEVGKGQNPWG